MVRCQPWTFCLVLGSFLAVAAVVAADTGTLKVNANRPGATIHIDGEPMGKAPVGPKDLKSGDFLILELTPGSHALRAALSPYNDFERSVFIEQDGVSKLHIEFVGESRIDVKAGEIGTTGLGVGKLTIKSKPPGAQVTVDGDTSKNIQAPDQYGTISAGWHALEARFSDGTVIRDKIWVEPEEVTVYEASASMHAAYERMRKEREAQDAKAREAAEAERKRQQRQQEIEEAVAEAKAAEGWAAIAKWRHARSAFPDAEERFTRGLRSEYLSLAAASDSYYQVGVYATAIRDFPEDAELARHLLSSAETHIQSSLKASEFEAALEAADVLLTAIQRLEGGAAKELSENYQSTARSAYGGALADLEADGDLETAFPICLRAYHHFSDREMQAAVERVALGLAALRDKAGRDLEALDPLEAAYEAVSGSRAIGDALRRSYAAVSARMLADQDYAAVVDVYKRWRRRFDEAQVDQKLHEAYLAWAGKLRSERRPGEAADVLRQAVADVVTPRYRADLLLLRADILKHDLGNVAAAVVDWETIVREYAGTDAARKAKAELRRLATWRFLRGRSAFRILAVIVLALICGWKLLFDRRWFQHLVAGLVERERFFHRLAAAGPTLRGALLFGAPALLLYAMLRTAVGGPPSMAGCLGWFVLRLVAAAIVLGAAVAISLHVKPPVPLAPDDWRRAAVLCSYASGGLVFAWLPYVGILVWGAVLYVCYVAARTFNELSAEPPGDANNAE